MSATTSMTPASLVLATSHAVAFLTRSLVLVYPATTVLALRHALTASLTASYAATWDDRRPTAGSGRRCLTLAPGAGSTPPRPIYVAAKLAGVDWARWMETLGNAELDLFVDPGCVRVRARGGLELPIWTAPTVAQKSVEVPSGEGQESLKDEVRSALRAAMRTGTRMRVQRALAVQTTDLGTTTGPAGGAARGHSRSSSVSSAVSDTPSASSATSASSGASSLFSAVSMVSNATSLPSAVSPMQKPMMLVTPPTPAIGSSISTTPAPAKFAVPTEPTGPYKMSRRERARQRRSGIVVAPVAAVTPYDGGRTNVLGGGVRLGGMMAQPLKAVACA
jgi:hypothetical protein